MIIMTIYHILSYNSDLFSVLFLIDIIEGIIHPYILKSYSSTKD